MTGETASQFAGMVAFSVIVAFWVCVGIGIVYMIIRDSYRGIQRRYTSKEEYRTDEFPDGWQWLEDSGDSLTSRSDRRL